MTEPVDLFISDMQLTFPKPREKKLSLVVLWPLLISLTISACDIFGSDPEEQTQIRFISFVSGSPALTATVSGETIPIASFVLSSTPSGPSGVPGFVSVESGSRRYQVTAASSDATALLRGTVSLSADTLYTGYVTGDAAEASLTLVGDLSPNAPVEGALIRVVHAYSRVGAAELAVHEVTPSPGGGLDAGAEIASTGALTHGDTSDLIAISDEQVAIVASSGARQGPTLLLSPVGGRLYTVVFTPPGGQFSNAIFGVGVYQEEI